MADPQAVYNHFFLPCKTREKIWCNGGLDCVHFNRVIGVRIIPALLPALFYESSHLREQVLVREAEREHSLTI